MTSESESDGESDAFENVERKSDLMDLEISDCQSYSLDGLNEKINAIAREAAEVLEIKPEACKLLLPIFNWNGETLVEKFFELDHRSRFLQTHGIPTSVLRFQADPLDCPICCEVSSLGGLGCEHTYCGDCWRQYCETKIRDEGLWSFSCCDSDCNLRVDENAILRLVDDEPVLATYQQLVINSYVLTNRRLKWCPATDCQYATEVPVAGRCEVPCKCGHVFCFECGSDAHEPAECSTLKKWARATAEDHESAEWMHKNSRPCPECKAPIEKNGGCNHITCRACRFEFCWVCLGNWTQHHRCNRFVETADDQRAADVRRFTHYMVRYMNHKKAMSIQQDLYARVLDKSDTIRARSECAQAQTRFLSTSMDSLVRCRRTLMNSYVFAFYLEKNNETAIFEDNQEILEVTLELLSDLLERSPRPGLREFDQWKRDLQDRAAELRKQRTNLLKHVKAGVESGQLRSRP